ncbi:MAG: hypothetical protein ACXWYV_09205 [Solirubrobacterales bacterium]
MNTTEIDEMGPIDLAFIRKAEDGEVTGLEISDLGDGLMNEDFAKAAAKKFVLNPNDLIAA